MGEGPLLSGLIAAPFTPFRQDGALDLEMIPLQAEAARGHLSGVFVCGTTGEGISMLVAERMAVAERWAEFRSPQLRVVVHVGGVSLSDSRELAAHAERIGADAVSTMGPLGFKPASVHDLVHYCAEMAAAAPGLPFYYYHMPSLNGVAMPMGPFIEAAAKAIPTFRGIKYTHEDLLEFALLLDRFGDQFELVFGRDELLIHALQLGARGAVGSTYNYMAPLYRAMMEKLQRGDREGALRDHLRVARIIEVLIRHGGGVVGGKRIMKLAGLDLGPCREPLAGDSAEGLESLRADLERVGFFESGVAMDLTTLNGSAKRP